LVWTDCIGFGGDVERCAALYDSCNDVCDVIGFLETIIFY